MAGIVVKSHFICFDFQKTFHSTDVFCTPDRLFVRLGFPLLCAHLAVHYFTVHSVLWSIKLSKPQRQWQRVQWQCTHALLFFVHHFFAIL